MIAFECAVVQGYDFMRRRQKLLPSLSLMVGGFVLLYEITVATALTPQEIAKTALGSTVHLGVIDAKGKSWAGSGFVVHDGQIATNHHVINDMSIGGVRLVGKEDIYPIEAILDSDKEHDLAVIKVGGIDVPALALGDSDTVQIGDKVYVAGNPQGLEGSFSDGIISAIRHSSDADKFFQMTAPISQGSSGGPVFNERGEVIGVSFATFRNGQNLNFAIPVNYLKALMQPLPTSIKPKPVKPKVDPPPVKPKPTKSQADLPSAEPKPILTPQEIHKIAERSTVLLETIDAKGNSGLGSGFIVHDSRIATNHHVIEDMSSGFAKLVGKPKKYRIKVLVFDKKRDLAIVKATGIDAPALSLGDSDAVQVADKVYVMGNPHRLEGTFSSGEISAIRPPGAYLTTFPLSGGTSWDWRAPCKLLQMTAPTSKGSSGGPVLNDKGEVIGIVFGGMPSFLQPDLTVTTPENLNFAIAVNYLKQLAKGEGIPITPTSPRISPIMKHVPPSRVSVGNTIPLTLDLISPQVPQQVTIHYTTYDRNRSESEEKNQKMRLEPQQSASSTWVYKVDLPSQKQVGSIEYYIAVEYDNHLPFKYPRAQPRHYQIPIVDDKPPTISVLYPPPDARFGPNQKITFRAKVTDNIAVKDVHIHTSWFNSQRSHKLTAQGSSNIYTTDITLENIVSLRYYLTATDGEGNESRSEYRYIEMRITTQENLEKGIKLYEQARYGEAIKALSSAVRELEDPKQRAEACLYLGGSKRGTGEGNDKVREQFQKAIRHNPDQELPPRLGKDHPIFAELIEEVRKELTGELTVISLLPETEIWIEGNEVDRKMLGTGTVKRRLLTGNYIVEGIDAEKSQRETIRIEPDRHKVLDLGIPPSVAHDPPPRISVGERIPLTLDLISTKSPKRVKIYYKTYDRDKNELEQNNQEMRLWGQQSASSTWTYKVDLPAQNHVGSIEYYIEIEYDSHLVFKYPSAEPRYYQISVGDEKTPTIFVLYPPDGAKVKRDQEITIRAKVSASHAIKAVHVHFSSGSRQKMSQEKSSDVYAARITVSQPLRYYLTATDEAGNTTESESRRIEIKGASVKTDDDEKPESERREDETRTDSTENETELQPEEKPQKVPSENPPVHQGIWASISSISTDNASTLDLDYMFRLAYLREGKNRSTLGAQLNFFYPDLTNMSAMVQWGPRPPGKTKATFTLLGGIAAYEDSPGSTHTTPIFGGE
jgi:S1-C subfamily serine protease/tetratricopeptide (TPR) repeat protein